MRSIEEIYRSMAERLEERTGTALNEGGDMSLRLWAVAGELYTLEVQAAFVARESFPQTASGTYLDYHAGVRGLQRGQAEKARGEIRFVVDEARESALTVPAGTVCLSASEQRFVTTREGVIPAGALSCTVSAEAAEAGSGGNIPAGAITTIVLPPSGISGAGNLTAFRGGSDPETDEALRSRVIASYRTLPNGANRAYYESKVLSVDGVEAVSVMPKKRGLGTVDVCFTTASGAPGAAKIAEVRSLLESEREICVDLQVYAPETVSVTVQAALQMEDGADFAQVQPRAEAAVRQLFSGKGLGQNLFRARLTAALMAVEGVANCSISAPAADVSVAENQLPVLQSLTLTEAAT